MNMEQQKAQRGATQRQADPFNARLIERIDLNPELAIFRVAFDEGDIPEFEAGQYTTLGLLETPEEAAARAQRTGKSDKPKLILRAYSIASSPKVRQYMEFFVVLVKEGALTPKLWQLREGDRLFMGPKVTGKFTLDGVPEGKDLVMIATGTGLAPFLSMLHTYRGTGRWRRFVIIHGSRLSADLGYREHLETIASEDPSVIYIPAVTREPDTSNWQGLRGRVHVALEPATYRELVGAPLISEECHVFLCGNPAMIDQVTEDLTGRGFVTRDRDNPQGNIHFERYW